METSASASSSTSLSVSSVVVPEVSAVDVVLSEEEMKKLLPAPRNNGLIAGLDTSGRTKTGKSTRSAVFAGSSGSGLDSVASPSAAPKPGSRPKGQGRGFNRDRKNDKKKTASAAGLDSTDLGTARK